MRVFRRQLLSLAPLALLAGCDGRAADELLHVSFDATRTLLHAWEQAFRATSVGGAVLASHGGSGKQTRSVAEGLDADLVSLAVASDVDLLARMGHLSPDWRARLPQESSPLASTVVMLVRRGNPKHVRTFEDLARDDLVVLTPNPKTSGGARNNHLAVYGALVARGDEAAAVRVVKKIYRSAPVLPAGARLALTTFLDRGVGDVLLAWESEAHLAQTAFGKGRVEVVTPPRTLRCDVPLALVDRVVDGRGSRARAEVYAELAYGEQGQAAVREAFFRPRSPRLTPRPELGSPELFALSDLGPDVLERHFGPGGIYEQALLERGA